MGKSMRNRVLNFITAGAMAFAGLGAGLLPASAQNMFEPVAFVNDSVVTQFELDQRALLVETLGTTQDPYEQALEALIDEKIQLQAAKRIGLVLNDEGLQAGLAEFAARGGLDADQLVAAMLEKGVYKETLRDFIGTGILWREVVRARFAGKVQITDAQIDRALSTPSSRDSVQVLLSEIFLPARTPEERAQSENIAAQIAALGSFDAFSQAARQVSVAPSREQGGRLPWVALASLPPALASGVLDLKPGDVTKPVFTGNAIGIFQLVALSEDANALPAPASVDYATLAIAGLSDGSAAKRVAEISGEVDECRDLYGVNYGGPESALQFKTETMAEVPTDIALELAKLDINEVSTALTWPEQDALVLVMLCSRNFPTSEASREQVKNRLTNQQLGTLAAIYLAELKADASIRIP